MQRIRLDHVDDDDNDPIDDVTLTDVLYLFVAMKLSADQNVCTVKSSIQTRKHLRIILNGTLVINARYNRIGAFYAEFSNIFSHLYTPIGE